MAKKKMQYQNYLVIAVLVLAAVFATFPAFDAAIAALILAGIGIVIGFVNISTEEVNTYLLIAITFSVLSVGLWAIFPASTMSILSWAKQFLGYIAVAVIPSAVLVGAYSWYNIGKP